MDRIIVEGKEGVIGYCIMIGEVWYLAVFFEQVKTRDFLTLTVQI